MSNMVCRYLDTFRGVVEGTIGLLVKHIYFAYKGPNGGGGGLKIQLQPACDTENDCLNNSLSMKNRHTM